MRARRLLVGLVAAPAAAGLVGAPAAPTTAPPAPSAGRAAAAVAVSATTGTTIAGIEGRIPAVPATVPFTTRAPNAHVDPVFARLAYWGAGAFVLLVVVQLVLTRPGRRGRRTL